MDGILESVDSPWKALVAVAAFALMGFVVWCITR